MKLLFRQRIFSWLDSYDIYNEKGETLFVVRGQLSWGHCLKIYDAFGEEVGKVKEKIVTFLPKFELFADGRHLGSEMYPLYWTPSKEGTFCVIRLNLS